MAKFDPFVWSENGLIELFGVDGPVAQYLNGIVIDAETFAAEEAPVDTGRLRANIQHEPAYRIGKTTAPVLIAAVGCNVEYAWYVHEGHDVSHAGSPGARGPRGRRRGRKKPRRVAREHGHVAGNPFLLRGLQRALGAL
jgi:hypothetical protein